jgi:FMN-dependent oxidoreductase (nitrilotriacetate monooxygenase family)
MFHLGWFVGNGFSLQAWKDPWAGSGKLDWLTPRPYIDMARALERACFDYMIFEDALAIPDSYGGTKDIYIKHALEVRLDPLSLVAILSQNTSKIGLIPTVSTSFYPPYLAARTLTTLDHLSSGRAGGNLVTSSSHRTAENFGFPQHFDHDMRYEMATEWMELVGKLCESWDPGAVTMDLETGTFADHTKIHDIDFEGKFFKSRGPLNTPPGPQRTPVICQAGGSHAGREFAAQKADTIIAVPLGIEAMKAYRDDISARMQTYGRKPSDCKVLYLINPVLADTDEEAQEKYARRQAARWTPEFIELRLAGMSYFSGQDFSKFDLDEPMPDMSGKVNGHQSSMQRYAKDSATGKTLRELAATHDTVESIPLVGTPDTVAALMGEAMEEVGGDGFLLACSAVNRKSISEVTDGLVPALQKRGLTRPSYIHDTLRDNLLEF